MMKFFLFSLIYYNIYDTLLLLPYVKLLCVYVCAHTCICVYVCVDQNDFKLTM